jgi:hypothetical protein
VHRQDAASGVAVAAAITAEGGTARFANLPLSSPRPDQAPANAHGTE